MSKRHIALPHMIGAMRRPDIIPGGFTHKFALPRHNAKYREPHIRYGEIKEAASVFLEGRGFHNQPTPHDSTAKRPEMPAQSPAPLIQQNIQAHSTLPAS